MSLVEHDAMAEAVEDLKELEQAGGADEVRSALHQLKNQNLAALKLGRTMMSLSDQVRPATAFRIASTENLWKTVEQEFQLLTADQVVEQVGAKGKGYASDARRHGRLMGVKRLGKILYPDFQLDGGALRPLMRQLHQAAEQLDVPEEAVLLWMVSPTTWWGDDARPVDHLDDEEGIIGSFRSRFGTEW